jgi:F-type H+-transporting ATPase subunit a
MEITPDVLIYWQWGFVKLNSTIVYTWLVMGLIVGFSWLVTRRLTGERRLVRSQNLLEVLVENLLQQIREVSRQDPRPYLPFVGTLFIFILVANVLDVFPGYRAPTGSLSTTTALALCVFFAVPIFGISRLGLGTYLRQYTEPTLIMLPFNIIGEFSRTLALAVRLFGNIMSGGLLVGTLLVVAPLFFPIIMQLLGLIIGVIQAYIFAVLAMVYIASATQAQNGIGDQ